MVLISTPLSLIHACRVEPVRTNGSPPEKPRTSTISTLEHRDHDVQVQPAWQLGRVCAAGQDHADGLLHAAAEMVGFYAVEDDLAAAHA